VLVAGDDITRERVADAVGRLASRGRDELGSDEAAVRVGYDLRYAGQAFELTIPGDPRPDPQELRRAFDAAHEERYGYSDPDAELELVNVRVAALAGGASPQLTSAADARAVQGSRPALFGGERLQTMVVTGEPGAGAVLEGPALCELPEATVVIPPGWRGEVGADGTLVLERTGPEAANG
jgi:N-methylhydantoinase A